MKRNRHLSVVPETADPIGYGVIGYESDRKRKYYVPVGVFDTALDALRYKGAAKDLHGYSAWDRYFAVAIYESGALYELRYAYNVNTFEQDARVFQATHPQVSQDFFSTLLSVRETR